MHLEFTHYRDKYGKLRYNLALRDKKPKKTNKRKSRKKRTKPPSPER